MSSPAPPPPHPPSPSRSPSIFTLTDASVSASVSGSASFTNHSPARPTHAQRGVRTNASSIHLSRSASVSQQLIAIPADGATKEKMLERSPSLSFLTHDPVPGRQRWSNLTATSGMADIALSSETESTSHGLGEGGGSGMAVRSSSPSAGSRSRSIRSVRSAASSASKARKRVSGSTVQHQRRSFQRKYGRWEVEMISPLLVQEEEERLGLEALLGRATMLERLLRSGKRLSGSGSGGISLPSSFSLRRPSTKTSTSRHSLSLSIRSVRRRLKRTIKAEDEFTEIDSQSGLGSAPPHEVVMLTEKERGWVVLIPEETAAPPPPPLPEKDLGSGCLSSPLYLSFPSPPCHTPSVPEVDEAEERERYRQSPHLGHRSPGFHRRQSVLSYISVGRWSASTQGSRRRRIWILWISILCVIGVIILVGVLAGLLSKRVA